MYCMAKNKPVKIWIIKHKPKIEPKFQKALIELGLGRLITLVFTILVMGCLFISGVDT